MNSVEQLLCGNCENPIEEHFNYCPNCGEKIGKEVETKKIKKNSCLVCGELIENYEIVCPACKMMAYE